MTLCASLQPSPVSGFPREVVAVRWYLRCGRSYRDVEELLCERGINSSITSPCIGGCSGFTGEFIEAARPCRRLPGDRWFVDETYVRISGRWTYLYRALLRWLIEAA